LHSCGFPDSVPSIVLRTCESNPAFALQTLNFTPITQFLVEIHYSTFGGHHSQLMVAGPQERRSKLHLAFYDSRPITVFSANNFQNVIALRW
jgi:hypothetical protein